MGSNGSREMEERSKGREAGAKQGQVGVLLSSAGGERQQLCV